MLSLTETFLALGIMTEVCTITVEVKSRRLGIDSSGITAIVTDCNVTCSDCATPIRYVSETAVVKDALSIDKAVLNFNVVMQNEHLLHGPPLSPVNPAIQEHCMSGRTSECSGHIASVSSAHSDEELAPGTVE